eukprot:TRINITY_DN63249_c0_g1_i1.p1 TRINITY_DN63249_c0_g1~~TRINITY_DN63249_c0_g1_i1.p1  ORF type:complete len:382 (+),score=57.64 TRINITY_DN63249_c0_g1_i1:100-1245(+)
MVRSAVSRVAEDARGDGRLLVADHLSASSSSRWSSPDVLAAFFAMLSCVLYCVNGQILQWLQLGAPQDQGHPSPMLNLVLCHLGGLFFGPCFCCPTNFAIANRKGFQWNLAGTSLVFATLLMGYNLAWLHSARLIPLGLTNAIFQTSIALVCAASIVVFGEATNRTRTVGVAMSLMGSLLACGVTNLSLLFRKLCPFADLVLAANDHPSEEPLVHRGLFLACCASTGYAVYQVLFKHWFGSLKNDGRFLAMFGLWVSAWHVVLFLPLVFVADKFGLESLQVPTGPVSIMGTAMSALIASAVNMMTLAIVMWGSSLLLPCSSAMSVPAAVALDFMVHGVRPTGVECLGHTMITFSVALIMKAQMPTSDRKKDISSQKACVDA